MKLTCCQCSRIIFDTPRARDGRNFCNNDFCLEAFQKVQKGRYGAARCDFPDFNATYPPSATGWGARKCA